MFLKADLKQFLQKIILDLIPTLLNQKLVIDRANRLSKPSHIPKKLAREVVAKIHIFHVKDMLMQFARHHSPLPDHSGLSQATIEARKNLNSIAKILQNHKIIYKWGFPTILMIDRNNISYTLTF